MGAEELVLWLGILMMVMLNLQFNSREHIVHKIEAVDWSP